VFEAVNTTLARWVASDKPGEIERFTRQLADNVAIDGGGQLAYLAPTRVNLQLVMERWPDVRFHATREISLRDAAA
jgi:peptide chain release factor 3